MSDWMKKLNKMEGAVDFSFNPFNEENIIRSPSPYFNYIFGKGNGLPLTHSMILYGPPKSGKSLLSYLMTAGVHSKWDDGIVIKFNTEMREASQVGGNWGIDFNRYQAYDVNEPELIFDRIKGEILPLVQAGMPLKLLIIDSLQGVSGVKEQNRDSITNHLMGDHAKTIQDGLKLILPIVRRNKIGLICTEHIRANLDAGQYGPKTKMGGGWGEKHFFEYYVEVKRDGSKESKESLTGEKFEEDVKDARGNKERTAHKIYCRMDDSSVGVSGRSGRFTFHYKNGLINIEEEIFELAKNLKLVEQPTNRSYIIGENKFSSKGEFIQAIKENQELANYLIKQVYDRDAA